MKNNILQHMLRFAQWVTITFISLLGSLMIHDAIQRDTVLSASHDHLETLKTANLDDPELAQAVRKLDYLYRVTYFQTQDRQSYGFMLLGIAFLTLCLLLVLDRYRFAPDLKVPKSENRSSERERKELLVYSACGIVIVAVILVTLRITQLPSVVIQPRTIHSAASSEMVNTFQKQTPTSKINLAVSLEQATHHWPQFRGSLLPNQNQLPHKWHFKTRWKTKSRLLVSRKYGKTRAGGDKTAGFK